MRNAWQDKAQDGIKIARRNINNRYTDNTTLTVKSEEELDCFLMRVKEESGKASLKLNIQKTKIMALVPSFHGKQKVENRSSNIFYFLELQNHCGQ